MNSVISESNFICAIFKNQLHNVELERQDGKNDSTANL